MEGQESGEEGEMRVKMWGEMGKCKGTVGETHFPRWKWEEQTD